MLNNVYQQYQSNSVMTATPGELTLMLYNGAIKFSNQAIDYMEKKDIENTHRAIVKVQAIIDELQVTLDDKYAISKEISQIYNFIRELLIEANINKDKEKLQDALYLIREFKNTWQEVMKIAKETI